MACPVCLGTNEDRFYDHGGPGRRHDEIVKPCHYCRWVRAFLAQQTVAGVETSR